ncbi:related to 4-hydroxybenzoate transporter [Cephalotrichum gorgonifer]|uniref:Related to 4-hydroxybenzoate transporter n=1 Tax=Cephalotrichum gorgonifer TaxID=2041049 RepID=A0AAE8SZ75_9PEZI|nr:related to 4-hydroxybenzoate transporter [Cephalotrichum gorgonifer]
MRLLNWNIPRPRTPQSLDRVIVPLEDAHLHSYAARTGNTSPGLSSDIDDVEDDAGVKGSEHETTGMLEMSVSEYSIEGLRREVRKGSQGRLSEYELRSKVINKAIQDIGMGRYNWQLFVLCGFGWFADNLWLQGISLTLPSLSAEFGIDEKTVRYTTSSVFFGLCIGSSVWGIGSDVFGRRIAFASTLVITSFFGILASFAPSWGWVCFFFAALGFGVGGNLPVDGALFLEFLPDGSTSLLTLLSVWWPVGQLVSSLVAWFFITNWPADEGWRHFVMAIGILTVGMLVLRNFVYTVYESPKYLISQGRSAEAVAVIQGVALRNGARTWLTTAVLDAVVGDDALVERAAGPVSPGNVIMDNLRSFSGERLRPLFSTRKLAVATSLLWFSWATIGMGYPLFNAFLPQYLSHGGAGAGEPVMGREPDTAPGISDDAYRNYAITSAAGFPGSLLATYLVDHPSPLLGRRGTLALSTLASAVFLILFATNGTTPMSQLFFSSIAAFSQNIMYGVLYAFTPEVFPAPVRGAGTGVASFLNRATGLLAPVLAANMPGDGTSVPVYMAGALIFSAFVGVCLIPIETRGAQLM